MKFARDILLIDLQATGTNPDKDFILQLAAILLHKDNLLEKNNFNSYIKHPFSQTTNDRIVQNLGIPKQTWMAAPKPKEVLSAFKDRFSYNVTLASHNIVNIIFFQNAFKNAGLDYEYDYHVIELWTLGYYYLAKQDIKKVPTAETLGYYFGLKKEKEHDAFENCRFLAEIFRSLVKSI